MCAEWGGLITACAANTLVSLLATVVFVEVGIAGGLAGGMTLAKGSDLGGGSTLAAGLTGELLQKKDIAWQEELQWQLIWWGDHIFHEMDFGFKRFIFLRLYGYMVSWVRV